MFTHSCIKCHTKYEDSDPEPYYCQSCNEQRKAIAAEVDAKLANRGSKKIKTDLQLYMENQQRTGGKFISSKIFGI